MRSLLTESMIARIAVRLFSQLPWEIRGSQATVSRTVNIAVYPKDLALPIDDFAEHYIAPAVLYAATHASEHHKKGAPSRTEQLDGIVVRLFHEYKSKPDLIEFSLEFDYTPSHPDHGMPVYFWLGEQSDVF